MSLSLYAHVALSNLGVNAHTFRNPGSAPVNLHPCFTNFGTRESILPLLDFWEMWKREVRRLGQISLLPIPIKKHLSM